MPWQGPGGFTRAVTGSNSRAEATAASGWEAREGTVAEVSVSADRAQARGAEVVVEKQQVTPHLQPGNERTPPTGGQLVSQCHHSTDRHEEAQRGPGLRRGHTASPQTQPRGTQGRTCFASGPWSGVREGAGPPASVSYGTLPPSLDVEAGASCTCPGQPARDNLLLVGLVFVDFFS